MSDNLIDNSQIQVKIIRYTVAIGLSVFIAALFNWTLAFVAPIFVAKFLVDKATLNKETIYELIIAMVVTMMLGLVFSNGITQYPVIMLLFIGLMMLWSYYLFTDPKWTLFAMILMIAILLLPFLGMSDPSVSMSAAIGMAWSGVVAVIIFALVHILFPEPENEFKGYPASPLTKQQRWNAAFRAMIISYPIVCYFFIFQISAGIFTMVFIALLSLMLTGERSIKTSMFLIISNSIGGIFAIGIVYMLALLPNIVFYTLSMSLVAILIATQIYTNPAKAPIYVTAFSSLLVLLGTTLGGGEVDNYMFIRIFQLCLVGMYIIFMSFFLESRNWKFLQM